jgi:predicted RNA binding protein YcfA (HicA-like mRNA interferase family)
MKSVSGRELAQLVERHGWQLLRVSGSHHIYGKTRQLRDARCIAIYHAKEIALADNFKTQRADAQFKKVQRAEDGRKAMSEYESDAAAVRAKTAQLRQLRLARDAKDAAAQPAAASATKAKRTRKPKSASGTLANWLKDREGSGHST